MSQSFSRLFSIDFLNLCTWGYVTTLITNMNEYKLPFLIIYKSSTKTELNIKYPTDFLQKSEAVSQ